MKAVATLVALSAAPSALAQAAPEQSNLQQVLAIGTALQKEFDAHKQGCRDEQESFEKEQCRCKWNEADENATPPGRFGEMNILKDSIAALTTSIDATAKSIQNTQGRLDKAQKAKADAKTDLASNEEELKTTSEKCTGDTAESENLIAGLGQALEALGAPVEAAPAAAGAAGFLQIRSSSTAQSVVSQVEKLYRAKSDLSMNQIALLETLSTAHAGSDANAIIGMLTQMYDDEVKQNADRANNCGKSQAALEEQIEALEKQIEAHGENILKKTQQIGESQTKQATEKAKLEAQTKELAAKTEKYEKKKASCAKLQTEHALFVKECADTTEGFGKLIDFVRTQGTKVAASADNATSFVQVRSLAKTRQQKKSSAFNAVIEKISAAVQEKIASVKEEISVNTNLKTECTASLQKMKLKLQEVTSTLKAKTAEQQRKADALKNAKAEVAEQAEKVAKSLKEFEQEVKDLAERKETLTKDIRAQAQMAGFMTQLVQQAASLFDVEMSEEEQEAAERQDEQAAAREAANSANFAMLLQTKMSDGNKIMVIVRKLKAKVDQEAAMLTQEKNDVVQDETETQRERAAQVEEEKKLTTDLDNQARAAEIAVSEIEKAVEEAQEDVASATTELDNEDARCRKGSNDPFSGQIDADLKDLKGANAALGNAKAVLDSMKA